MDKSFDAIGDAVVAAYPNGAEMEPAPSSSSAPEPAETSGAGSGTASPPAETIAGLPTAAAPALPSYAAWDFRGRKIAPDGTKFLSPEEWQRLTQDVDQELADGRLRQEDYTRKTQGISEMRKQLQQAQSLYGDWMKTLAGPGGMALMLSMAAKAGWKGAEEMLARLQQDPNYHTQSQLAAMEQRLTNFQKEQLFNGEVANQKQFLAQSWQATIAKRPHFNSPSLYRHWLELQSFGNNGRGMEPEEAAEALEARIGEMTDWNFINAIPSLKERMTKTFRSEYLAQKAKDNNLRVLSGGASPVPTGAPSKSAYKGRDLPKALEAVEEMLKGQAAG